MRLTKHCPPDAHRQEPLPLNVRPQQEGGARVAGCRAVRALRVMTRRARVGGGSIVKSNPLQRCLPPVITARNR